MIFLFKKLVCPSSLVHKCTKYRLFLSYPTTISSKYDDRLLVQVNLCQKLFFLLNMLRIKIVLNFRNNFCTQHVLPRFEPGIFIIELVIQWTICCHIVGYVVDAKIRASDKDLPVVKSSIRILIVKLRRESRPVYYSILNSFGQSHSTYLSIKFPS